MKKFTYHVTEIYSGEFSIEAETAEEAYEKIENMCNNGDIDVMDAQYFIERNIELD